jgi:hypothetical protein
MRSSTVAVVMSRLRRLVVPGEPWLSGLRGTLRKIAVEQSNLIVADGTAGTDFVRHFALRLNVDCRVINVSNDGHSSGDEIPLRDRALINAADLVYVLQLRLEGNLHRLLKERIEQHRGGVVLVDLPGLQPDSVKGELLKAGVEFWRPTAEECRPIDSVSSPDEERDNDCHSIQPRVYEIVPFPCAEVWEFLAHTTRSRPGPWPDESFEQYADSLAESRPDVDHSTLSTLRRIVVQKRLIPSGKTIRGGCPTVSFTACPLENLPALHRYRTHRVRWDFEPYGLCIRRSWLESRGVRPVRYGDEALWQSLTEDERPFFQLAVGESGIDWTIEQEWRAVGDISLRDLTSDDVILFVPDFESAKSLASVTNWPITLWPGNVELKPHPHCGGG